MDNKTVSSSLGEAAASTFARREVSAPISPSISKEEGNPFIEDGGRGGGIQGMGGNIDSTHRDGEMGVDER
jgi:hypothetical protein